MKPETSTDNTQRTSQPRRLQTEHREFFRRDPAQAEILARATTKLLTLRGAIESGQLETAEDWGGAGLIITRAARETPSGALFYPDPTIVVTPFAAELSWLVHELWWGAFAGLVGSGKHQFFADLGSAAARSVEGGSTLLDTLLAVLDEAARYPALYATPGRV